MSNDGFSISASGWTSSSVINGILVGLSLGVVVVSVGFRVVVILVVLLMKLVSCSDWLVLELTDMRLATWWVVNSGVINTLPKGYLCDLWYK